MSTGRECDKTSESAKKTTLGDFHDIPEEKSEGMQTYQTIGQNKNVNFETHSELGGNNGLPKEMIE